MRILLVNYRYFISGGPEKYMFNIKKLLEDKGNEVIPFSIHSNRNEETEYSRYFVEPIGGRDATYFEDCKKTPGVILKMIARSSYSLEVKHAIQKEIRDVKPDLVYIIHFVNKLSPSVITGAKEMGIPVVLRLSDYFMLCPRFDFLYMGRVCEDCITKGYSSCLKKKCVKGSLLASLIRVMSMKLHDLMHIYDHVDAFVTPSVFLKNKLVENGIGEERITCIPTFTMSKSNPENGRIGDYGLYIGRITEEKGVETLVKAYEKLPDKKVKIVGDDSTKEALRLREYVKQRGINNIIFTGFLAGVELEEIVKNCAFTIVPSIWYENLPNSVLEAFQYSKPVIAGNIGSLTELITDGQNGFLFTPGDPLDLADKIRLMDDRALLEVMGKNCRIILDKKYSPEAHYEKLVNVFNRSIEENRCINKRN